MTRIDENGNFGLSNFSRGDFDFVSQAVKIINNPNFLVCEGHPMRVTLSDFTLCHREGTTSEEVNTFWSKWDALKAFDIHKGYTLNANGFAALKNYKIT